MTHQPICPKKHSHTKHWEQLRFSVFSRTLRHVVYTPEMVYNPNPPTHGQPSLLSNSYSCENKLSIFKILTIRPHGIRAQLNSNTHLFCFRQHWRLWLTAMMMSFSPSSADFLAESSSSCISDSWSCRSLISVWYCSLSIFTWNSLIIHKTCQSMVHSPSCCINAHTHPPSCTFICTYKWHHLCWGWTWCIWSTKVKKKTCKVETQSSLNWWDMTTLRGEGDKWREAPQTHHLIVI